VWTFEDCAVAFIHRSGLAVGLDAASAAWLLLLEAPSCLDELISEVAAATEADFEAVRSTACSAVHQLWLAGVVGPIEEA
jgi:hypothetical protein